MVTRVETACGGSCSTVTVGKVVVGLDGASTSRGVAPVPALVGVTTAPEPALPGVAPQPASSVTPTRAASSFVRSRRGDAAAEVTDRIVPCPTRQAALLGDRIGV